MIRWLLCAVLFVIPLLAVAQQEERVLLEGIVLDADSLQVLPSVHVRITNSGLGGVTEADGRFRLRVNPDDSVVFSSVGYKPYLIVPSDSTEESLRKLIIRMKPQVTVLEEVRFKDYQDLSKYIRREYDTTVDLRRPKGKPLFEDQEPEDRPAVSTIGGMHGANLEGGLTALANLFSSEFQQKKKLEEILKIEEEEKRQQSLKEAMTERYRAMVLTAAALTEPDLQRFTDKYMPHPLKMMNMNDYDLMAEIVLHLQAFETEADALDKLLKEGVFEGEKRNSPE
ncbi:carboxypeptidase-like regulatory domain-containing protein [Porifericola rhodea]|uniref:carboxypeptidase-like regulatory domain-containing protein n=1 Tax=Porifericola rhodea TaxID=930972 RepID=UPI002666F953|nr:carboxypeptidase-like regulatory domain-containing protein [Porifericola rhodea]WKN29815.1 carboxypeptidase-like regulatory domain-containing protein [Porifericola rhodea]